MDTKASPRKGTDVGPGGQEHVVHQLRVAARRRQNDARRQWIRAATRC